VSRRATIYFDPAVHRTLKLRAASADRTVSDIVNEAVRRELGQHAPRPSDGLVEAYKKDLDRSLIRENLRRTPEERVRNLAKLQCFAGELERAGRRLRDDR